MVPLPVPDPSVTILIILLGIFILISIWILQLHYRIRREIRMAARLGLARSLPKSPFLFRSLQDEEDKRDKQG